MNEKFVITDFKKRKDASEKITILTAYDFPTAKIVDASGADCILVGDSLGMVVLGYEDTVKVTMDDMLHHIKAAARGTKRAFLIGDMPFLSYHTGKYDSVRNAGRLISEGGCKAVKLEGGEEIEEDINAIINAGIPVMGHLGYTPQSINLFGGHKAQGKTFESARKIMRDALILQKAGAFSIVLECVPYKLAKLISEKLIIPTIGIGSGPDCDGQVLVTPDILGLSGEFRPKHSKRYVEMGSVMQEAIKMYIEEVTTKAFPTEKNSFIIDDEIIEAIEEEYK